MTQTIFKFSACALIVTQLLTGCSLAPDYNRPELPVKSEWSTSAGMSSAKRTGDMSLELSAFVSDKNLLQLITLAQTHNRDLRQAILNVEASRAQYGIQRAGRLPEVNVQASGSRQRSQVDQSNPAQAQVTESWQAGLGIPAYELDMFGRIQNLSDAALQEYLASSNAARSAHISLTAEVIRAYITRDSAVRQRALARQTLESRQVSLQLISDRRSAGASSSLDYEEAAGLLEQAQSELERADRQVRLGNNALLLLTGVKNIASFVSETPVQMPYIVKSIAPGLPSELLEHRPDIQAAENRLRARNADIGAARAAFYPRISLTGMYGTSSADLSDLFSADSQAWSFMPQISIPIFAGGRNQAALDLANVRRDIAIAAYEQSIQIAFRETSDALDSLDTLRKEEEARTRLAQTSRNALRLAEARYNAGIDDHLRYLDAQRNAFTNESGLIEVDTQRQLALVDLFRSLGGGWKSA